MSLFVVLNLESLPPTSEINSAARELNAPIEIQQDIDLNQHEGFLPVKISSEDSGVETYVYPYTELSDTIPKNEKLEGRESLVLQFRWGGDFKEAATAFYTAQILTLKYNGVAFDPQSAMFLQPEQLAQGAEAFANMPQ